MNINQEKKIQNQSALRARWLAFSKRIKPWNTSFFSRSNISLPKQNNFYERIKKNLDFFEANYFILVVLIACIGLYEFLA